MSISIRNSGSALTEADVAAVEQRLRVKFPDDYRAFLLRHNGGIPRPDRFRISTKAAEAGMDWGQVRRFYSVGGGTGPDGEERDLERVFQDTRGRGVAKRLVPIAMVDDPLGGGILCISVDGRDRGRVYYHPDLEADDRTVYGVTKSFDTFFDRLARQGSGRLPAWVVAVQDGDPEALRQWLDGGGELTERHELLTPIELAAHVGKLELVKFLVKRGAPVGDACLHAMDGGQAEVVRWFFAQEPARKVDPNALISLQPGLWRDLALVRTLIEAGAEINHRAFDGRTPLHWAAQYAPPEVVRFLLQSGARAESFTNQRESPLHRAVFNEDERDMIANMKLLIDSGLDLHARTAQWGLLQPAQSAAEFLVDIRKGTGLAELEAYTAKRENR